MGALDWVSHDIVELLVEGDPRRGAFARDGARQGDG
jgi:hypothetical protein